MKLDNLDKTITRKGTRKIRHLTSSRRQSKKKRPPSVRNVKQSAFIHDEQNDPIRHEELC